MYRPVVLVTERADDQPEGPPGTIYLRSPGHPVRRPLYVGKAGSRSLQDMTLEEHHCFYKMPGPGSPSVLAISPKIDVTFVAGGQLGSSGHPGCRRTNMVTLLQKMGRDVGVPSRAPDRKTSVSRRSPPRVREDLERFARRGSSHLPEKYRTSETYPPLL